MRGSEPEGRSGRAGSTPAPATRFEKAVRNAGGLSLWVKRPYPGREAKPRPGQGGRVPVERSEQEPRGDLHRSPPRKRRVCAAASPGGAKRPRGFDSRPRYQIREGRPQCGRPFSLGETLPDPGREAKPRPGQGGRVPVERSEQEPRGGPTQVPPEKTPRMRGSKPRRGEAAARVRLPPPLPDSRRPSAMRAAGDGRHGLKCGENHLTPTPWRIRSRSARANSSAG